MSSQLNDFNISKMFKFLPFIRVPNQHFITPGSKIEKVSCSVSYLCLQRYMQCFTNNANILGTESRNEYLI